ncbi:transcription regulator protein BACH1b [Nothobranchius furzeri]|uniref:Transcription regulator protein BACH1-like n=3 Tax=Nothobranchius TaxID=28779 RepID=A0A8C6P5L0_NOTFU|nr:transcription regulator protein BACH1-like [Nothobranchius furzeri]
MFQMATPRSSVFTFESTVHSSHVLQWLDEQRCRDLLCDVTVLVEGQSFRAHRSVLASCSDYFAQRISSPVQHGAVLTLPDEVTSAGFEPLLKFAYTSKLHFGKEDVLEIQSAASLLGFKDLDEACFDFLLPKLFSSNKSPPAFVRKCCKKACKRRFTKENGGTDSDVLGDKEAKPVADSSSQRDAAWERGKSVKKKTGSVSGAVPAGPPVEDMDVAVLKCPKYRKFQLACEKENGEKIPTKSRIRDACSLSCFQCSSSPLLKSKTASNEEINGGAKELPSSEIHEATRGLDPVKNDSLEEERKQNEKVAEDTFKDKMDHLSGMKPLDTSNAKLVSPGSSPTPEENPECSLPPCPLIALNELSAVCRLVQREEIAANITENQEMLNPVAAEPGSLHQNMPEAEGTSLYYVCQDGGQTGSVERSTFLSKEKEVAGLPPASLGSRTGTSQPNVQEWAQSPSPNTKNSCPFLLELHPASCSLSEMSECEVASQSGVSSMNSGEDGDSETETEGDCDFAARERALQVQLPYPMEWIVSLSRNDFQQLLKQQTFTREQLDFVHDMRRRSKNRLAAQRCRKRKLDCIYNLQYEIHKLKSEREKLLMEQNQLNQMKMKTCHTVNTLCQRVCREADLQPDQLQALASYTTSDCPLSSFFPHIDSLLSQYGPPLRPQISVMASSGGRQFVAPEDNLSRLNRDTIRVQHSL